MPSDQDRLREGERAGDELLLPAEMSRADQAAIKAGVPGITLMENAGKHVAEVALGMLSEKTGHVLVLCGPGNNGGDGLIAARLLRAAGCKVDVQFFKDPLKLKGDARLAFEKMDGEGAQEKNWQLITRTGLAAGIEQADLVIDALFGAGLDRPLKGDAAEVVETVNAADKSVLSVDLPSGVSGATGSGGKAAIKAQACVTFFRLKPGHLLLPGRELCGKVHCFDIGMPEPEKILEGIAPKHFRNSDRLWFNSWRIPQLTSHKYDRGHAVVFGGPVHATGAARLSAEAALRAGAGLVTLACPPAAVLVNACHLTSVMIHPLRAPERAVAPKQASALPLFEGEEAFLPFEEEQFQMPESAREQVSDERREIEAIRMLFVDERLSATLIGPGFGVGAKTRDCVMAVLAADRATVLDADALTCFSETPEALFFSIAGCRGQVILTPHAGEFRRLFPDLFSTDKLTAAQQAARRCGAVIVLKGADTVIAAPDGRVVINDCAPPWLATAGSGDVLAGIATGLLAQGMTAFEAASMAVWLHSQAGHEAGIGLVSEELSPALKAVFEKLVNKRKHKS